MIAELLVALTFSVSPEVKFLRKYKLGAEPIDRNIDVSSQKCSSLTVVCRLGIYSFSPGGWNRKRAEEFTKFLECLYLLSIALKTAVHSSMD